MNNTINLDNYTPNQIQQIKDLIGSFNVKNIKYGDNYYYLSSTGEPCISGYLGDTADHKRMKLNNIYKTHAESRKAADMLLVKNKIRELAEKDRATYQFIETIYTIEYNKLNQELDIGYNRTYTTPKFLSFYSYDGAKNAIEIIGEKKLKEFFDYYMI